MEKPKSMLEEAFEAFLKEARTHPSQPQPQIAPPADMKIELPEEEPEPAHDWYEDFLVDVYDRTNERGVEIPSDADFVVRGRWANSQKCCWETVLEKAVKTFPEVELLVIELWQSYRDMDSFTLRGNDKDPRFKELCAKLGLVKGSIWEDMGKQTGI